MSESTISLQSNDIELAVRSPLPPSTSSVFASSYNLSQEHENLPARNESSIAPVDEGFGAWSFLAAAFFVEAIVWGFPTAFGLFLEAYLQDPYFANQKNANSLLPLIGTMSSGIIYCSGPFLYPVIGRYPQCRRPLLWIGAFTCSFSLFGASYATSVKQLVGLQGVLYAIGGALTYSPCISYLPEWFVNRRGFANGVIFAGTAAGGLMLPLTMPLLLSRYGAAKTLRILSIFIACVLIPLVPFIKGRLPEGRGRAHGPAPRGSGKEWMKNISFWVLIATNTLQGFAYFLPLLWLPTFANDLKLSRTNAALTLALVNGSSLLGRLSLGYLSDKLNPWLLALVTLSSTSLATFILWGILSTSFAGLLAFGIAYGTLAGGFTCLWTGFLKPIAKDDPLLTTNLFGYLLLSRGLGNIFSTPISSVLSSVQGNPINNPHHLATGFQVGDGRFEKMIVYVGTCFAGAAVIAILGWMDARRGRAGNQN